MSKVYFTPGPSHPYPGLREFMDDAWKRDVFSISHRGNDFVAIYRYTAAMLRQLLDIPFDYEVMFLGSATEAMERILQGVVEQHSHHLVNGAFSEKWYEFAKQLGKQPTIEKVKRGEGFDVDALRVPEGTELICITQNETSTGAAFPIEGIRALPRKPLIALDVVSSAPIVHLPWDRLDLVFFSIQKAFGLPAGLGVLIASPRSIAKAEALGAKGVSVGSYHGLHRLAVAAGKFQTPATPNVAGIYLLGRVAEDILARGISSIRRENAQRARLLYELIGSSAYLRPFVREPMWRSPTTVVAELQTPANALHETMAVRGYVLGKGYKPFQGEHIRIANFPLYSDEVFNDLLKALKGYKPAPPRRDE